MCHAIPAISLLPLLLQYLHHQSNQTQITYETEHITPCLEVNTVPMLQAPLTNLQLLSHHLTMQRQEIHVNRDLWHHPHLHFKAVLQHQDSTAAGLYLQDINQESTLIGQ